MHGLPGQGNDIPHLIQHLKDEFTKTKANNATAAAGSTAEEFWGFCADYMDKHRVVEQWPSDRNFGIKLSNNTRVLISPATAAGSGDMQDSSAVQVTEGATQPGQEGVNSTASKHIT